MKTTIELHCNGFQPGLSPSFAQLFSNSAFVAAKEIEKSQRIRVLRRQIQK